MIVINEPQHSSVTTTAPPQIPNLNISPLETDEPWSFSYTPTENTSNSNTFGRNASPIPPRPQESRTAPGLGLPDHSEKPIEIARQPSPGISAIGSIHDGDVPSRSISEVTRPTNSGDERSPNVPFAEEVVPSAITSSIAADGSRQPRLVTALPTNDTAITRSPSTPVSDALGPVQPSQMPQNGSRDRSDVLVAKPTLPQDLDASTERVHREDERLGPPADLLTTPQKDEESTNPAAATSTPEIPNNAEPLSTNMPLPGRDEVLPDSAIFTSARHGNTATSRSEDISPLYSGPTSSKEVEVAAEKSQNDLAGQTQDTLPAYQSPNEELQTESGPRIGLNQPIIPVSDLSSQRKLEDRPAQARPFSFIGGNTLISPVAQTSTGGNVQSSEAQEDMDPLAKEISIMSTGGSRDSTELVKRKSKSYSRPFVTDPNVMDHPAYRPSQDMARPQDNQVSEGNRNVERFTNKQPQPPRTDGPYRIPGPYVQQYRSPKQPPTAFAGQQAQPKQQTESQQVAQYSPPGLDPLRSHDSQGRNGTGTGIGTVPNQPQYNAEGAFGSNADGHNNQHRGGLLRARSKSRSIRSRNDEVNNTSNKLKKEKRTGFFRQRSKPDNASIGSRQGSVRNSIGSRDALASPALHETFGPGFVNPEAADQVGNLNNARPHPMLRDSPVDHKKKRFSGFGGLFGRSGGADHKKPKANPAGQAVQRSSTFSHFQPDKPDAASPQGMQPSDSRYMQDDQQSNSFIPQDQATNNPRDVSAFQGPRTPADRYFDSGEQKKSQSSTMPHDPDSFTRGRLPADRESSDRYGSQDDKNGLSALYQTKPPLFAQQQRQQDLQQQGPRPPLHIDTSQERTRRSVTPNHHFVTAPPGPAPQLPLPSQSRSTTPSQGPYRTQSPMHDPRSRSPYGQGGAPAPVRDTHSHAIDLHKRSRSPRNGRRLSSDEREEVASKMDPANQLGTFSRTSAPQSGRSDGQEAPWRIEVPNSEEEEKKRKSQAVLLKPEQDKGASNEGDLENIHPRKSEEEWKKQEQPMNVAEKVMGVQLARSPLPLQRSTSDGNARPTSRVPQASPVELPGSKAPGDDSDDEIVMSSTAYPGQEWMPEMSGYGHWDD